MKQLSVVMFCLLGCGSLFASSRVMVCTGRCTWLSTPQQTVYHTETPGQPSFKQFGLVCGNEKYDIFISTGGGDGARFPTSIRVAGSSGIFTSFYTANVDPTYSTIWQPRGASDLRVVDCKHSE